MKILIVDDDPATLLVSSLALENSGDFEVFQAKGGSEAVELARKFLPEVILMDLVMNDLDGQEVLQILRSERATENIPVIFHSARNEVFASGQWSRLGAKGFIRKPSNPLSLPAEVRRLMGQ